ncbi:MAG: GH32 C-terminal domain-containing protein [Prolixibacteraceae bacterium]
MRVFLPTLVFLFIFISSCISKRDASQKNSEIHFTLNEMELDAPIELVFFNNEYHLFYQYKKGLLSNWGHSKSSDLISWEHVPLSLISDSLKSIGSGSVVVDWNNTCGLGNENPPMLAFFITDANFEKEENRQSVSLAFSIDFGKTWEKSIYPIVLGSVSNGILDLQVIWHEERQSWIMMVLTEYDLYFLSSEDMINWSYENKFNDRDNLRVGIWSQVCFFPIQVEESNKQKWVLLMSSEAGSPNGGSGIQYFIGDFDGHSFDQIQTKQSWLDNGSDNFAGVCLSSHLDLSKPLFYLAMITNRIYESRFDTIKSRTTYTLPRMLTLVERKNEYFLYSNPIQVSEGKPKKIAETKISGILGITKNIKIPLEINLMFDVSNKYHFNFAESLGIQLSSENGNQIIIGYNNRKHIFFISEQNPSHTLSEFYQARYLINTSSIGLKIIIDHSSLELFALDGMISLTKKTFTSDEWHNVSLFSEKGESTLMWGNIIEK